MGFSCSSSVAAALRAALEIEVALERPTGPLLQKIESLRYKSSSACFTVPVFAASSRTSWSSDLNSHFSSAAIKGG